MYISELLLLIVNVILWSPQPSLSWHLKYSCLLNDSLSFRQSACSLSCHALVHLPYVRQVSHCLQFPLSFVGRFDSPTSWWDTFFFWDAGLRVKAERWSDGPPLLPDLLPLLCVVDLLLGSAVEERKRTSDWGMASRAQTLAVRTFVWRWVAWKCILD